MRAWIFRRRPFPARDVPGGRAGCAEHAARVRARKDAGFPDALPLSLVRREREGQKSRRAKSAGDKRVRAVAIRDQRGRSGRIRGKMASCKEKNLAGSFPAEIYRADL